MVGSTTNRDSFNVTSASTAPLSVTYRFDDPSWLQVTYVETDSPTITTLVSGTDYTPGGDGETITGTITLTDSFLETITSGVLVIARFTPALQELDLQYNTRFPSELTEKQLDWIVMALQDRSDSSTQAGTRAIVLPPNEPPANTNTLQVWTERAGKLLYNNAVTGSVTTISIEDIAPLILAYYDGIITAEDVLAAISAIAPLERFTPPTTSTLGKFGQLAIIPEHVDLEITGTLSPDITGTLLPWKTQNDKIWFSTGGVDPTTLTGDAISVLISWTGAWIISVYEFGVVNVSTRWASFPGAWLSDPYPNNVGTWIPIGTTGQPSIATTNAEVARAWVNLAPTDTVPNWREITNTLISPELFGAVGDGVADDTDAFQAALDLVSSLGGGTVWLGGGKKYQVTQNGTTGYCLLISTPGVVIRGQGLGSWIACNDASADTILVAEGPGPYDSGTVAIDDCEIHDVYFNPLIQKADAAREIHVPYTRHFRASGLRFGRRDSLITGTTPEVESKIGTFLKMGDRLAPVSSTCEISDVRGFGYYRAWNFENIVDVSLTAWESDANRANAQSCRLAGASEGNMIAGIGMVNSQGVVGTPSGVGLLIESDSTGMPRYNKFSQCFFDTHARGIHATAGASNDFVGCWANGMNLQAILIETAATNFRFTNTQFNYAGLENIRITSGTGHVFSNCEALGGSLSDPENRAGIYIGASVGTVDFNSINMAASEGARIPQAKTKVALLIEDGAGAININGGAYRNGVADFRNASGDVSRSDMVGWFRANLLSPQTNRAPASYWQDSSARDGFRIALSADSPASSPQLRISDVPCARFNLPPDANNFLRFVDDVVSNYLTITLEDFEIIVVQKTTGDNVIIGAGDTGLDPGDQIRIGQGGDYLSIYVEAATDNAVSTTTLATARTEWSIIGWSREADQASFWENGAILGTAVTVSELPINLTRVSGATGALFITGSIAEILIFSRVRTAPERSAITTYLQNKYAEALGI